MAAPEQPGATGQADLGGATALVDPSAARSYGAGTKLLLFDIDGTILASGGAGERSLRRAALEIFGNESGMVGLEIAGRTDTGIARQLLGHYGVEATPARQTQLLECYLRYLQELLPITPGRLLPGVIPLLEELHRRESILLGLLTGNLARGAELKLRQYGVWHYFVLGAYADDHHDRNELGHFARQRVLERHSLEIAGAQTYVLGDTPYDIACGRAIGARTVAVATGIHTRAQLAEHHPDYLFDDFSDLPSVLAIFEDQAT